MPADLDALLTHVYVLVDDLLPRRRQRGRPVRISNSELICLSDPTQSASGQALTPPTRNY